MFDYADLGWVYWTILALDMLAGYVVLMSIAYWVLVNVWGRRRINWDRPTSNDEVNEECGSLLFTFFAPLTLAFAAFWWLWHRVQRILDSTQEKRPPRQGIEE